jgi:hypothetical protein
MYNDNPYLVDYLFVQHLREYQWKEEQHPLGPCPADD